MTQKKKRPMKQNGGGGWFSSLKLSSAPEPEPEEEEEQEEPYDILLITTHGDYSCSNSAVKFPELPVFKSRMKNIIKINASSIGESIKLTDVQATDIKDEIMKINNDMSMEKKSRTIMDMLIEKNKIDKIGIDETQQHIKHIGKGDEVVDKDYVTIVKERFETSSPYFDTITLLTRKPHNDLLQEIKGRTAHSEQQYVVLSVLLNYLYKEGIRNLIIVDLTCSTVSKDISNRTMRFHDRHNSIFGGNYKNKSIGKVKKLKQTNNKKLRNTKTKRRKTRKMRRRLNK